jgi:hypothetical protein
MPGSKSNYTGRTAGTAEDAAQLLVRWSLEDWNKAQRVSVLFQVTSTAKAEI